MYEEFLQGTQLRLIFATGLDEFGQMQSKSNNYNNVKTSATAEQLWEVATALFGLQSYTSNGIERYDSHLVFKN